MTKFTHLHVHTEYSLLDGAIRIHRLGSRLKELGMDSIAITDHGVMYGAVDFYDAMKAEGIKPIIGCEVYVAAKSRFSKETKLDQSGAHLILLAENNEGYKNLCKIVSIGFVDGFYYRPRVDIEVLKKYSKGIIALSACLGGEIPSRILANDIEGAKAYTKLLNEIFGQDNFYLELQDHGIEGQRLVNSTLIDFSNELNIPVVATNDSHYMNETDAEAHEVLLCMQTGKTINDPDRMTFGSDQFYLKSGDEMNELFGYVPEALSNSVKIAERCNVEFDYDARHLPHFEITTGETAQQMLLRLCNEGMKHRYGEQISAEMQDRLEYELNVINKMGFVDYFLITQDFINYAKQNKIMVGPGRGSAAGSIVSYVLGITNIDPLKYNLIFERFLNPERVTMPDIDIDFCYERRQEVIDYVVRKYGEDRVAQIITFGTLQARAALKDTGRALAIPYQEVDKFVKLIPFELGMTLDKAYGMVKEIQAICNSDERFKQLYETARLFEGMPRHSSTHAAGVVVTAQPVTEYVPVQKQDNSITTQYTMTLLEKLGLLKMDFLGLRTLTVIRDAVDLVKQTHSIDIDIDNINIDDKNVYAMLSEGKTSGIFQLESRGMASFMKDLQPDNIEDIIAGVSLYRPGPMDSIPTYITNKKNKTNIKYLHPKLESILDVTYGCMVYQEQVMEIFRELAGYTMGRSDMVRRAISKKKADKLAQEKALFIQGAVDRDVPKKAAEEIYSQITAFASYAFNKSHAAAYAVVAYQTAWLKYYYPVEFMAAMLNSFLTSTDKISQYISETKAMGIAVLPPDINSSYMKFSVTNGSIRFGLGAIKNVGETAVHNIINERGENGVFKSFIDFCKRLDGGDVNKKCVESMIKCGAFDSLGHKRAPLMASFEKIIESIAAIRKRNMDGQLSLFDMPGMASNESSMDDSITIPDIKEYNQSILLSMEKEMLGIYLSGHPLAEYRDVINNAISHSSIQISELLEEERQEGLNAGDKYDGLNVVIAGIVTYRRNRVTRSNDMMAMIAIEDLYGPIELMLFPRQYERLSKFFEPESIVVVKGNLSIKEDETKVVVNEVKNLLDEEDAKTIELPKSPRVYLRVFENFANEKYLKMQQILSSEDGDIPVFIFEQKENNADRQAKVLEKKFWINYNFGKMRDLEELLGEENIKFV